MTEDREIDIIADYYANSENQAINAPFTTKKENNIKTYSTNQSFFTP